MLHACARNILQAREVVDGVTQYQVGPTIYRGLWIVDGCFIYEAAIFMGHENESYENALLAYMKRIKPDGSFAIMPTHDKETGISIATLIRQCELMNDYKRLQEIWPSLLRSLSFIQKLLSDAQKLGPDYIGITSPALLDGGVGGPYAELTTPPLDFIWSKKSL